MRGWVWLLRFVALGAVVFWVLFVGGCVFCSGACCSVAVAVLLLLPSGLLSPAVLFCSVAVAVLLSLVRVCVPCPPKPILLIKTKT